MVRRLSHWPEVLFYKFKVCKNIILRVASTILRMIADKPFSLTALPYANHVYRFPMQLSSSPPEKIEQTLSKAFLSLLDLSISTIRHDPTYPPGKPSYNVLITLEHMHLIPRRREVYILPETGALPINSLGFAGMLLVRNNEELEAVVKEGFGKILHGVGLESVHDEQVAGTTREADDLNIDHSPTI